MRAVDRPKVTDLIFGAVEEVNLQRRRSERLPRALETIISGEGSQLDSLGLVNLIFSLEQKVELELGVTLSLADDLAAAADGNPFRTLGTLAEYVHAVLERKLDG